MDEHTADEKDLNKFSRSFKKGEQEADEPQAIFMEYGDEKKLASTANGCDEERRRIVESIYDEIDN